MKVIVVPMADAGCGGSAWRHTPAASATAVSAPAPASVVRTPVPGEAKPQTMAEAGARWRTMWLPSTLDRVHDAAAEAGAAEARAAEARAGEARAASSIRKVE